MEGDVGSDEVSEGMSKEDSRSESTNEGFLEAESETKIS